MTSTFQAIVIGVFIILTIVGVGIFAMFGGAFGGGSVGQVTIWGTIDSGTMATVLERLRASDKSFQDVQYAQRAEATYEADLLNAMASGTGPDLFFVTQDQVTSFADKVYPVPYRTVSQATFVNSYIDEAQLFLTSQGALALPILVDPLVMYYNRDMLSSAGVAGAPVQWNELFTIAPKITKQEGGRIVRSAVALGQWENVAHAKEILSALFLQAGDRIITRTQDGKLFSVFGQRTGDSAQAPAESALRFYTEFANPSVPSAYSWNRSLKRSTDAFAAGELAIYFGRASEYQQLLARNPNLRIGVAQVPQLSGATSHATFAELTGAAISRSARNPNGALTVVEKLASQAGIGAFATVVPLPPVRRDVVLDTSGSAAAATFVQSALVARGWLDPSPTQTDRLFKEMIESVISGKSDPAAAVGDAAAQLGQLLQGNTF